MIPLPSSPETPEDLDNPATWAPTASFLKMAIPVIFVGLLVMQAAMLVYAPGQNARHLAAAAFGLPTGIAWLMVLRGRVRAAYQTMGFGIWIYVTLSSFFFGGIGSATIIIYPLVIHLSGWLYGIRVGARVAAITIATTLGLALGQTLHWLPELPPSPPMVRWIVDTMVFTVTAYLVAFYVRTYRTRLEKEQELARKLAALNAELEQRVESRTEALRDSVAALESFSYSVAHDLRTPLRTIEGYNSIVLAEHGAALPGDSRELLERARGGARKLATLIDGLLALSKVSRAQLALGPVNMQALADGACERATERVNERARESGNENAGQSGNENVGQSGNENVGERIGAPNGERHPAPNGVAIAGYPAAAGGARPGAQALPAAPAGANPQPRFHIGPLPPAHGDATLLRQVWINLIDNAVKFSGAQPEPLIEIGCIDPGGARRIGAAPDTAPPDGPTQPGAAREGAWLSSPIYFVRDHGVGFDMAYADKLFGVFERLHVAQAYEGSGLGLAIVKRIVEHHRGQVWARSVPGEGSTFYFCLGPKG